MLSVACKKWAALSFEFESCCAAVLLAEYTLAEDNSTYTSPTATATSADAAVTTPEGSTISSTPTSGAEVHHCVISHLGLGFPTCSYCDACRLSVRLCL